MSVELTPDERDLLARPVNGILTVAPAAGRRPVPRPVWFEYTDDGAIEVISEAGAPKVRRLRADPWASLLVTAPPGEPERWVALDGPATLDTEGGREATVRLARRYWDLDDPQRAADLEGMLAAELVRIVIRPERIARYAF